MTKVIIISTDDGKLDGFYEQTLRYIGDKYHNYPTCLGRGRDDSEYDPYSRGSVDNYDDINPNINLGKTVF